MEKISFSYAVYHWKRAIWQPSASFRGWRTTYREPATTGAVLIDHIAFWIKAYIVDVTSIEHVNDNIPSKPGENDLQGHPTKDRSKNCRCNGR